MVINFTALNNACVLYYSMDNADISGTTLLDLTPNNNDGTINGATTGAVGILNEGIFFNGVDDYVTNLLSNTENELFISFWINPNSISDLDGIFMKNAGSNNLNVFGFYFFNNKINFRNEYYVTSYVDLVSTTTISTNQWYHIAIGLNSNTDEYKLYINGVEEDSSTDYRFMIGTYLESYSWIIGYFGGASIGSTTRYYDGLFDELAIVPSYTTAGTPQELATYYFNLGAPTSSQQYLFSPNVVYEIKGQVTLSGTATQGATLRLYDQTEGTYEGSTTTDVSGNYLFENLTDTNEYHVSVEYDDGTTKYNDESKPYVTPTGQ